MVGAEGLLGTKTYSVNQLTSGYPETAGVNCIKMARAVKYMILLWNYVNHDITTDETDIVVSHYRRLMDGRLFEKGKTLYELWLIEDLVPAFSSEGVTMTTTVHNDSLLD